MILFRTILAAVAIPLLSGAAMAQPKMPETVPVLWCQADTPELHQFVAKGADGKPVLHIECTKVGNHPESLYPSYGKFLSVNNPKGSN